VKVLGDSMRPTYYNGTRHYVNKLAYWSEKPSRGDVVTVRIRDGEVFIKRIVGLPGERVEVKDGRIAINGHLLHERYTGTVIPWKMEPVQLGSNDYFVIGDNRAESLHGAVPADRIIGKVIF
jgi:signal peptidase I